MGIELFPVEIVGDHPHAGRRGNLTVIDGKVTTTVCQPFLPPMVRVEFDDGDACFAEAKDTRPLKPVPREVTP